jgi:hypothetical protein
MNERAGMPREPQRTDSGRFVRNAVVFVAPLVLLLVGIEARMSAIPNNFTYKQARLEERRGVTEALVLGSSHEFQGVDTEAFGRPAFNLAMASQSLSQSSEIAMKYLQVHRIPGQSTGAALALPRLRYILLGISYYSLPYRMSSIGSSSMGFYLRAFRVFGDTTVRDLINPTNYLYMGIYGWPAVQGVLRNQVEDYVGRVNPTGSYRGSHGPPANAPPRSFASTARLRAMYHQRIGRDENIPVNLEFMRRLARECQRRGVTLVLFTSPVTREYADSFGESSWLPRRQMVEEFSREFAVDYLDYSSSAAFTWRDFANADHLNGDGATRFARMLSTAVFGD